MPLKTFTPLDSSIIEFKKRLTTLKLTSASTKEFLIISIASEIFLSFIVDFPER